MLHTQLNNLQHQICLFKASVRVLKPPLLLRLAFIDRLKCFRFEDHFPQSIHTLNDAAMRRFI